MGLVLSHPPQLLSQLFFLKYFAGFPDYLISECEDQFPQNVRLNQS